MSDLVVAPGVVIPERELEWSAARASGPGGQNVNKVSTKIELRFDLAGTRALDPGVKARLARLANNRLDADGKLVIVSQSSRSQLMNLEAARERLAELVRAALVAPKRRKPTRPSRAAKERRLEGKRRQSERKRARSGRSDD